MNTDTNILLLENEIIDLVSFINKKLKSLVNLKNISNIESNNTTKDNKISFNTMTNIYQKIISFYTADLLL